MGNDLKNIDNKLLNDIVKWILKVSQPEKIILFGSYARGDATRVSDIDILVVQSSNLPRYKRSRHIRLAVLS